MAFEMVCTVRPCALGKLHQSKVSKISDHAVPVKNCSASDPCNTRH